MADGYCLFYVTNIDNIKHSMTTNDDTAICSPPNATHDGKICINSYIEHPGKQQPESGSVAIDQRVVVHGLCSATNETAK